MVKRALAARYANTRYAVDTLSCRCLRYFAMLTLTPRLLDDAMPDAAFSPLIMKCRRRHLLACYAI